VNPDPEDLDRLVVGNPYAPEALRWRVVGLVDEVFWQLGEFDVATGRWVPRSLNQALESLGAGLGKGQRIVPGDDLFQVSRMAEGALKRILDKPRQRIQRRHEMVPLASVRELDQPAMAWLARQPGESVRQKLAGRSNALAPVRRFSTDSPENRMVAKLLRDLGRALEVRLDAAEALGVEDDDENRLVLRRLYQTCVSAGRRPDFEGLASGPPPTPNNVMISDRSYSQAWRAWRLLRARQARLTERWNELESGLLQALFWGVTAEICYVTGGVVAERLCKPDAKGHQLLVTGDIEGAAGWLDIDAITVCVPNDERFGLWRVSRQDGTLRLRRTKPGPREELVLSLGLSGQGLRIQWCLPETGEAAEWEADPTWGAFREVVRGIVAHLVPSEDLRAEVAPLEGAKEPIGLDLRQGAIRAWHNGREVKLDLLTAAVRHRLPEEDGGNEVWLPGRSHRLPPPDVPGAAVAELWSCLVGADAHDVTLRRQVCVWMASGLGQVLQGTQRVPVAFTVPDSASDFTLRDLRAAMRAQFSSALAVWRSVAIASAWLQDGTNVSPGDVVVVVDGAGHLATATVLIARHDAALAKQLPETKGLYWERRYVLPEAWFDGCQGVSAVADEAFGSGGARATHVERVEALMTGESLCCLESEWESVPAVMTRNGANKVVQPSLSALVRRVGEWRRDWSEQGLGETTILLSGYGEPGNAPVLHAPQGIRLLVFAGNLAESCRMLCVRRLAGLTTWVDWIPSLYIETLSHEGYFQDLELSASERIDLSVSPRVELDVKARLSLDAGALHFDFPLALGALTRESLPYMVRLTSPAFPLSKAEGITARVTYDAGADQAFDFEIRFEDPNRKEKVTASLVDVPTYSTAKNLSINLAPPTLQQNLDPREVQEFRDNFTRAADPNTGEESMLVAVGRAGRLARRIARAQPDMAGAVHELVFRTELGHDLFQAFVQRNATLRDPRLAGRSPRTIKVPALGRNVPAGKYNLSQILGFLFFDLGGFFGAREAEMAFFRVLRDVESGFDQGHVFTGQLLGATFARMNAEHRERFLTALGDAKTSKGVWRNQRVVSAVSIAFKRSVPLRQQFLSAHQVSLARTIEFHLDALHAKGLEAERGRSNAFDQQALELFYESLSIIILASDPFVPGFFVSLFSDRGMLARKIRRIDAIIYSVRLKDSKPYSRIRVSSGKSKVYRAVHDLTYVANLLLTGDEGLNLVTAELGDD
jgi:hypothetical protein